MARFRCALVLLFFFQVFACGPTQDEMTGPPSGSQLLISPENPQVVSRNGVSSPVDFTATLVLPDGRREQPAGVTWAISSTRLGQIDPARGHFVATGLAAGSAEISATIPGLRGTTGLDVHIDDEYRGEAVPADAPDRFAGTPVEGTGAAPTLVYPLEAAVVPQTVKPPDVQWEGGGPGDLYRVTVEGGLARITAYVAFDSPGFKLDWLVGATSWTALRINAPAATFVVDRWAAGDQGVYRSAIVKITIVPAEVSGALYYWDLSDGRILRITEAGRERFMPDPPPRPSDGARCVACHTVSRDGRYLAAELWGGGETSTVFDLSLNLSVDPPPTMVPPGTYSAIFSTFNPDATRLLINDGNRLRLVDPLSGAAIASMGLPESAAAHPTWSPDGMSVAYIANHNGTWPVDYTSGDLAVLPYLGADSFGAPTILRPGEGLANAWPSFSPDSQWIAYGRGVNSRGRNDGAGAVYPGSLWLVSRAGGPSIELANANGGPGQRDSYLPSFSPFDEGGYFWLAFYTTRDYGNALAGTKGTGRRQIWITAVKNSPAAGADPSSVPYWLPDQDVATHNMSAYWTEAPPLN